MFFFRHTALILTAVLMLAIPVSGCSSHVGGQDYNAADAHRAYTVHQAVVLEARPVTIHGDTQGQQSIGGIIGAIAGAALGGTVGRGTGRTLAAVGGGLLGTAAGIGAGTLTSQETGLQLLLRDDYGNEEVIIQGAEPAVQPGQRVRVIVGSNGSRRAEPVY